MGNDMGKRIAQKRKENNMTMEELGAKLGVNKSAVHKWEHGVVENIKQSTIKQMSIIFDCSPSWLMGYDDENVVDNVESTQETNFSLILEYAKRMSELREDDQKYVFKMIDALHK